MADQGKWFKLWYTALHDADLENLPDKEWRCWVSLGTYMKAQGSDGTITFVSPATALLSLFHVDTFGAAIAILRRFPRCTIEEVKPTTQSDRYTIVSVKITYQNWLKYQGDFSTERVRKYRSKKRPNETLQEERRGEETKSLSLKSLSPAKVGRSAPPDAPAPRPSAHIENDTTTANGHEDFLKLRQLPSDKPSATWGMEHLERWLTNYERVQSKMREKLYNERGGPPQTPVSVREEDQF